MKIAGFFLVFWLTIMPCFGQSNIVPHKLLLTVSPSHLVEFYHGTSLNLGVEFPLNEKFNFYGEVGQYLPNSIIVNNYYQKGNLFLGEVKYYFKPEKTTSKHYLSLQYLHGNQSYTRADPIGPMDNETSFSVYEVDKEFHDLSVRYGILFVNEKRLVVNPYIGVGLRYQEVINGLTEEQYGALNFYSDWSPHRWIHRAGNSLYAKIHLGIRIGIKLF